MGPVILLQTTSPIDESWADVYSSARLLVSRTKNPMSTKGTFLRQCRVHAASQEDDGFVFITIVHAVILSWDIDRASSSTRPSCRYLRYR